MKKYILMAALAASLLSVNTFAKDLEIVEQNTNLGHDDLQKVASIANKMGVKEPLRLKFDGEKLQVAGSSEVTCTITLDIGEALKIKGVACHK